MMDREERKHLGLLLDFEYLFAEFYGRALNGRGLSAEVRGEDAGAVKGGRQVDFANPIVGAFVEEASRDASSHIALLRRFLAGASESPYRASTIDLTSSFNAMARGAGLLREDQSFDAFFNETNLLLGAFMLEDVGMTACAYAICATATNLSRDLLVGLYGSLASRSAIVRALLFTAGLHLETNAIATHRQKACGLFATAYQGNDHGVGTRATPSMMPVDLRGLSWSRTSDQCAAIVAGRDGERGSFFPLGISALPDRLPASLSLVPVHYNELSRGIVEDGVALIASFAGEPVEVESVTLDPERFRIRENTVHQPWTQKGYTSWAPSCIEITNAVVLGSVGIVGVGRHVIAETLWHTEPHRHRYRMVAGSAELDLGMPATLEGTTVSILVGAAESYWHALIDAVARLVLVPDEVWPKIDRVLYPSTGVRVPEMLDLFGLPSGVEKREVKPHESFSVDDVIPPSSLPGLFDSHPTLRRKAFARLGAAVDVRGETHRRIFIDRRGSPLRQLTNEDELIAALSEFVPVRLETLTVAEQIRLFRNADIIVAPHGAGLTNIGFSRPGTVVIELMMDSYCNWCYRRLAALKAIRYRCVMGRCLDPDRVDAIHFTTWEVDKDELLREVDRAWEFVLETRPAAMA